MHLIARHSSTLGLALALACLAVARAEAQTAGPGPYARCARVRFDDRLRPVSPALVAATRAAFGLQAVPLPAVERGAVWRCADGKVLACFVGANLPCGKLDRREALPAVAAWCRSHPGGPVPASVSGHATLWRWRCQGATAMRDGAVWQADARGFASELWKPLDRNDG